MFGGLTADQLAIFLILVGVLAMLVWDRLRYDLVALTALLVSVVVGVVPADKAFRGFSDDIVIIVGSALVVSAAVARSGLADTLIRRVARHMKTTEIQVGVLVLTVALLSAFMKNIGALAILMPIAIQVAQRNGHPPSRLLMPLAFGALLGGLMTLIGTSPNIIVSRMRTEILGHPFEMFDFLPVGAALTLAGVAFLVVGWRLLPKDRRAASTGPMFQVETYQAEVRLPPETPFVGKTVRELEDLGEGDVTVAAIIREKRRRYVPSGHWVLYAEDVLILECDAEALDRIVDAAKLELIHDRELQSAEEKDKDKEYELPIVEAVVAPGSALIGSSARRLRLRDRVGINLLAISRHGQPITTRLHHALFQAGDLIVLRMRRDDVAERLASLGCLPLAQRRLQLGRARRPLVAPSVLALAMILAATGTVPVSVAFFGAAVAVLLLKALTLREAYEAVEWPILVLLGALIPVSDALSTTGGTDLISSALSDLTRDLPPTMSVALVMATAMAVTPFLNNAATVLMMAPIGASLAAMLGLRPDPFLMAVAVGAACDFLTPIGHQCNTLVMGPGGYRFGDYWRLGLPLSLLVLALGVPLIVAFWPLD